MRKGIASVHVYLLFFFSDTTKYLQKLWLVILFVKTEFDRARPDVQTYACISGFVAFATALYLHWSS